LFVNQACAEIFGFESRQEIMALDSVESLIAPYELQRLNRIREQHFRSKRGPAIYEFDGIRKDGTTVHLQTMARVMEWKGAPAAQVTLVDITDRNRAEYALRDSEERFRSVFENSPAAIVLKDLDGRFRLVNGRFREWFGRPSEDLLGKTTYDIYPRAQAEALIAQDWEVLNTLGAVEREHMVSFSDGSSHTMKTTKFPVFDSERRAIGIGSISVDVTEQKAAEERLHQALKMEALGQLTGGVAHDFNNLLAVIMGNAELLDSRLGSDNGPAQAVLRAASRGAELTQRLLAFSRRQPLHPEALDLPDLVDGMTDMLRRTLGETIEVKTSFAPDLSPAMVDRGQVENALLNLAINARDAMTEGGELIIELANATLDQDYAASQSEVVAGDYVVLSVSDSGTGMSAEVLAHAFEPFFTTKGVGVGSGLGLSMVYGFAKQSGGHVTIHSEEGRGTTAKVYLPCADKQAVRLETNFLAAEPRARGETVLVLEDDPDVRSLAVAVLQSLSYEVMEAPDGESALALLRNSHRVDLLLSDVVLSEGLSGPEVAERARRAKPALKVLFMSGYPRAAIRSRGRLGDEAEMLNKPFRRYDLAQKVRAALDLGPNQLRRVGSL
jgi:two-component system CheB/CheR fusion protein